MKRIIAFNMILSAFLLLSPRAAYPAPGSRAQMKPSPHGILLQGDGHKAEVNMNTPGQGVDVYVIEGRKDLPNSVGISFYDKDGRRTELELKALDTQETAKHYHGLMSMTGESFMGIELKIPFGKDKPAILRRADDDSRDSAQTGTQ